MQVPSARQLALACACSLVAAAPAHAAGWAELGPISSAPTGGDEQPQIAFEPNGDALAVWVQNRAGGSDVVAATRPAGGTWSAPKQLTSSEASRYAGDPEIAMDDDGNALVVWFRDYDQQGREQIQYATKPADGDITTGQALPGGGASGALGFGATAAFDADGDATVLFEYDPGPNADPQIRAVTRPRGGAWGAPEVVTDDAPSFSPRAGFDADGNLTVLWTEGYLFDPETLRSKTKPAGGAWPAASEDVGAPATTRLNDAELVVRPDGTAIAAWSQFDEDDHGQALTSARDGDGAWTTDDITPGTGTYDQITLDGDAAGRVTFAARLTGVPDVASRIVAGRMPATGTTFGDVEPISHSGNTVYEPAIDTAADGTPTIAWRDGDDDLDRAVVDASSFEDGEWTFPAHAAIATDQRSSFREPFVAHDQHDNVLVAFAEGSDERAAATGLAVFDHVAPTLDSVSAPATATTNQAVTFSATAHDDWLPVLPHWGFGDTFQAGFSVAQAFTAGTHQVHVGAVDLVGNTSELQTRSITVTDPPAPAPAAKPAPAPAPAPQPAPAPVNPITALVQRLFGGRPGTVLGDVRLGSALVYGTGEVAKGGVKFGATSVPLFAFVAQRDTQLTVSMSVTGVPAGKAKAAASVKLKGRKLSLKAGQGAVVTAKLTAAQRKLVRRAKGRARLVVKISEKGGKTAMKKLRLS